MNFREFKSKYQKVPVEHYPDRVPDNPKVSVCVQTYQHVDFIEDCLEGILMQDTDFSYEILVGEDASKDGTREVCVEFAERYPEKIKLFLHHRQNNIQIDDKPTGRFNFLYNLYNASGEYIALCDGDDYWTDPLKLQKQVEFMEVNRDYTLCVGGYETKNENSKNMKKIIKIVNDLDNENGYSFTLNDITKGWITKVLTSVIRVNAIRDIDFSRFKYFRDVHLFYHLLTKGKGFYFTEVFGVYRIHGSSVFSSESKQKKSINHYYIYKEINEAYRIDPARIKLLDTIKGILANQVNLSETDLNKAILFKESFCIAKTIVEYLSILKALIPYVNKLSFGINKK